MGIVDLYLSQPLTNRVVQDYGEPHYDETFNWAANNHKGFQDYLCKINGGGITKAFNRSGLVKKKVTVHGPRGTHQAYRWVREGKTPVFNSEGLKGKKIEMIRTLIAQGIIDAKSIKEITGATTVQIYREFSKSPDYEKGSSRAGTSKLDREHSSFDRGLMGEAKVSKKEVIATPEETPPISSTDDFEDLVLQSVNMVDDGSGGAMEAAMGDMKDYGELDDHFSGEEDDYY